MFANLGPMELFIILVIVLVLFGARRVPEIGASIGKGIREFKKNINEIDRDVRDPIRDSVRGNDQLSTGAAASVRHDEEPARPEPKRLI
jgi:sec-independent protein translocase protein TatA